MYFSRSVHYYVECFCKICIFEKLTIARECWNRIRNYFTTICLDPKAETRLYIMVNDFEFHVYNRSELYGQLQELFGLDPTIIPAKKDDEKAQVNGRQRTHTDLER